MQYVPTILEQLTITRKLQLLFPIARVLITRTSHPVNFFGLKKRPAPIGHLQYSNTAKYVLQYSSTETWKSFLHSQENV